MGFWTNLLILGLGVLLVLTFLPKGVLEEEQKSVEVTFRINQAKPIGWIPGLKDYNIDNVQYHVIGDTNYIEWDSLFFVAETGTVEVCIDSLCQYNSETFWISPGEQRTTSETIHGVTLGSHTLKITITVDDTVKDTYTEMVNI